MTDILHALFDSLRAEHEADYLPQVLVEPACFGDVETNRSVAVVAEAGMGKTALRLALSKTIVRHKSRPLIVEWTPPLEAFANKGNAGLADDALLRISMAGIFDACAVSVIHAFASDRFSYDVLPSWAKMIAHWFVQRHLQGNRTIRLSTLEESLPQDALPTLRKVIDGDFEEVLPVGSADTTTIAHLNKLVTRMGYSGVWLMVDGLETWSNSASDIQGHMLGVILGALGIFDQPGFIIKIFAPEELRVAISQSPAAQRRRLEIVSLDWDSDRLTVIVEKRLAVTLGIAHASLADLCRVSGFQKWLIDYGGVSPRGWLSLISPLLVARIANGRNTPLSRDEWIAIWQRRPPPLRFDLARGTMVIGYGRQSISGNVYQLLRYLYLNRDHTCSKSEIYYRVLENMDHEPTSTDKEFKEQKEYEARVDTLIWQARQKIEPSPKNPVYVITIRGAGITLSNTI